MYANTKIETLTTKQIKKVLKVCAKWCHKNLGVNNRKKYSLSYSFGNEVEGVYGLYNPVHNHIYLNLLNCKNVGKMCSTFIHEYTHHLQPVRTKYVKSVELHGYWDCPFEVEARNAEKKFNRSLLFCVRAKCSK